MARWSTPSSWPPAIPPRTSSAAWASWAEIRLHVARRASAGASLAARRSLQGRVQQRAADIVDVDDPDETALVDDRQVPEMPGQHRFGRVANARRRRDDGRTGGHQITNPDVVDVLPVRHRPDDVSLGDQAERPPGLL